MRIALFIGGRSDYTGPAVRILPRTGARVYLSERWKVDDLINNNDRQQQLTSLSLFLSLSLSLSLSHSRFLALH